MIEYRVGEYIENGFQDIEEAKNHARNYVVRNGGANSDILIFQNGILESRGIFKPVVNEVRWEERGPSYSL